MEEWRLITEANCEYAISNYGRLKSFKRNKNGSILSNINKKGDYFSIILKYDKNKKRIHTRIHCLVAKYFIGDRPIGFHVHHIDGNKQNNNVNNLMYISTKEHYLETLSGNPQIVSGMVNYNQKIRPKKILQFSKYGEFIAEYNNSSEAHEKTGICSRNILQVASKDEYKPGKIRMQAGGYIWKFK